MSRDFDEGIALEEIDPGHYRGHIDDSWWIDRGPNGGYLAGLILAGAQRVVGTERPPVSLTVHYTERPVEGEVRITTVVEREGRSITTLSVRLLQDERLLAMGLTTFSTPRQSGSFDHLPMPEVAKPEELPEPPVAPEMMPAFSRHFEYRFALGGLPYTKGSRAEVGGWIRPRVPRSLDGPLVATFADAWVPSVFVLFEGPIGVPTVDLTVHFRAPLPLEEHRPGDWTLVRFVSRWGSDGLVEESGTMWSPSGRVIAQSRQLALFRDSVTYWPRS